jgi:hypothetical protein
MRTYLFSALTVVTFGLLTLAPANANGQWSCIGPAVACDSAPAALTYNYRSGDGYEGERPYRRQATSKRSRNRVAKHVEPSQHIAKNVERTVERGEQAKIDLPERKQASVERTEPTEPKLRAKGRIARPRVRPAWPRTTAPSLARRPPPARASIPAP